MDGKMVTNEKNKDVDTQLWVQSALAKMNYVRAEEHYSNAYKIMMILIANTAISVVNMIALATVILLRFI